MIAPSRSGQALALVLLLVPTGLFPARRGEVHERAGELIEAERWEEAAEILTAHVRTTSDDAAALALLGQSLLRLERADEAAHYLEEATRLHESAGDTRAAKGTRRDLARADGLNARRERIFREVTSKLYAAAERLHDNGHPERALGILEGIAPVATGRDAAKARELLETVRATFEEVDLDRAGTVRDAEGYWSLVSKESDHYRLECNLEPDVVELVADTMDDIHGYYVQLYFDGDEKRAESVKATIRIHPDKDAMLGGWGGDGAPEGWWSPGQNTVVCYDTRTSRGTLDWMLNTLFHEASHQFMTLLSRKGGWSPAWLNEGTASFFEGAVAMADHRVLWPDAAIHRLFNLVGMLESGGGPAPEEVVGFKGGGSYPGEYYPFGWGLVFFLQQYEDPETLEYAYRPFYSRYRETITSKGGDSMELFQEVFLDGDSPLGHDEFGEFAADWRRWILETVKPLHMGHPKQRRELRMAEVERYLQAADLAAQNRRAPVPEDELLRRALGHIEYVRTRIDDEESPDLEVHLLQADVLLRLDRPESAAPILERVLDLADDGLLTLEEGRYEEIEKQLRKIDSKNWALRSARSRVRGLRKSALRLLEDYRQGDDAYLLRAYTFAAQAGAALDDQEGLLAAADELRAEAREAGLLVGRVRPLGQDKGSWQTIYDTEAKLFSVAPERIEVESVRPVGYVETAYTVGPEYELRARFVRKGEVFMSTVHGLVVAGHPDGEWFVFGFGKDGHAGLWRITRSTGGGAISKLYETLYLDEPLRDGEHPEVAVHVSNRRQLEIRIEGREPIETELSEDYAGGKHVGVYVKDGRLALEAAVIELYP